MPEPLLPADGDFTDLANALRGGFELLIDLRFTRVTVDEVRCTVPVTPALLQAYGLVHGGIYAAIVESCCSTGAGVGAALAGRSAVGLDNSTRFLRGTRSGSLHAWARPEHAGRRSQVWTAEIRDDQGRLVASGSVRLMILAAEEQVGGADLTLPTPRRDL